MRKDLFSNRRLPLYLSIFALLLAFSPLLYLLIVSAAARMAGCELIAGLEPPCTLFGMNLTPAINRVPTSGFYLFATLPIGLLLFLTALGWSAIMARRNRVE